MYSLIHVSPMVRFSLSASTYLSILSYKLHNAERKKDVHAKTSQQLTKTGCTANDEFFHGRGEKGLAMVTLYTKNELSGKIQEMFLNR